VSHGSLPNLEISLIAEIASMAGNGWINQDSVDSLQYKFQAKAAVTFVFSWN
jgi:hypothetical protein